jgi:soluble lytic murein transglycosylase-like protein
MNEFVLGEVQKGLSLAAQARGFKYKPDEALEIANAVLKYSRALELDPLLVLAVMKQESHFAPRIVSKKGAIGLMQVEPRTVRGLCKIEKFPCPKKREDFFNPKKNIEYGVRILNHMLRCTDTFLPSLAAYNQGCSNVQNALLQGQTTWEFTRLVLGWYSEFMGLYFVRYPRQKAPVPPELRSAPSLNDPAR